MSDPADKIITIDGGDSPYLDGFEEDILARRAAERAEREPLPTDRQWVTVYSVSREYGGPEEGGWYYDMHVAELTIPTERQHAETVKAALEAREEYSNVGRRPLHSVLSTGRFVTYIEDEPAATATRQRPRYC